MTKVKATDHLFKKGQSGNPKGRAKGQINEIKRKSLELRKKAIEDLDIAYNELRSSMQIGEAWAHQIYFKELVPFKKEWLSEVDTTDIKKKIANTTDMNEIIAGLSNKLLEEDQMPREEVHNVIKTLSGVKLTEEFGKRKANPLEKLSDEQLLTIKKWIDDAV